MQSHLSILAFLAYTFDAHIGNNFVPIHSRYFLIHIVNSFLEIHCLSYNYCI